MSVKRYTEFPQYTEHPRKLTWYPELYDVGYWIGPNVCKEERPYAKDAGISILCFTFNKDTKRIAAEEIIHMSLADAIKLGAVLICKGINAMVHYRSMAKQAERSSSFLTTYLKRRDNKWLKQQKYL